MPIPQLRQKKAFNHRERWFDAEYVAEQAQYSTMNTKFCGDALPKANPNLGPDALRHLDSLLSIKELNSGSTVRVTVVHPTGCTSKMPSSW